MSVPFTMIAFSTHRPNIPMGGLAQVPARPSTWKDQSAAIVASPTTVGEILRRAKLAGLTYPLPAGLSDAAVESLLYPPSAPSKTQ